MNKMNKKMEYALMAVKIMDQKPMGTLTTAKEVSDQMHISFEATARVLQALSSRGLLKAEYGVGGGYSLSKSLAEVSIHDLAEMLEEHTHLTKCLTAEDSCEVAGTCNIVLPINKLNQKIQSFYKSISLHEVLYV